MAGQEPHSHSRSLKTRQRSQPVKQKPYHSPANKVLPEVYPWLFNSPATSEAARVRLPRSRRKRMIDHDLAHTRPQSLLMDILRLSATSPLKYRAACFQKDVFDSSSDRGTCAWNPTSADPSARGISRASVTVQCDAHERGRSNRVCAHKVCQIKPGNGKPGRASGNSFMKPSIYCSTLHSRNQRWLGDTAM
jgi:hypothetical protein